MVDVFVSYTRDDQELVRPFIDALRKAGVEVSWDVDIAPGVDFRVRIEEMIRAARRVVVIWSPRSIGSRFVKDDADLAQSLGSLVSVCYGVDAPPLGHRQNQYVVADDLTALPVPLASMLRIEAPPPPPPRLPWHRIGTAIVVLGALAGAGWLASRGCSSTSEQDSRSFEIARFESRPPVIEPGDVTELSWETSGAESVELDVGTGLRPVEEAGTFQFTPFTATTCRLVARGPNGESAEESLTVLFRESLDPPPDLTDCASVGDEGVAVVGVDGSIRIARRRGDSWMDPVQPAGEVPLRGCAATEDGQRIVAVGDRGTVVASSDAGASWRVVDSGVDGDLRAVACWDDETWVVGKNIVLVSKDRDQTWSVVDPDKDDADLYAVEVRSGLAGPAVWIGGFDRFGNPYAPVVKLSPAESPEAGGWSGGGRLHFEGHRSKRVSAIAPTSRNSVAYAALVDLEPNGLEHGILRMRAVPDVWDVVSGDECPKLEGLHYAQAQRRLFGAGPDGVFESLDGVMWEQRLGGRLTSISGPQSGQILWVVGDEGRVFRSDDGGAEWTQVAYP
ncbi:MAG: TIR domain-containing protein [Planctomycetota bacterium]